MSSKGSAHLSPTTRAHIRSRSATQLQDISNFKEWDTQRVAYWLKENNFEEYQECFVKHRITGEALPNLNYTSLKDIGVLIVGDRARIIQAVKKLLPQALGTRTFNPRSNLKTSKSIDGELDGSSKVALESPNTTPKASRSKASVSFANISTNLTSARENQASHFSPQLSSQTSSNSQSSQQSRNPAFRTQREGMKPLVIFPRSSSMKEKAGKTSTQQDLSDAFDSVFGNISSANASPNLSSASNDISAFQGAQDSPNSEIRVDKDIMNMKSVREKCVRVHGLENQTHIINIAGMTDPKKIRQKILLKFGQRRLSDWQVFISSNDNLLPISDSELMQICEGDNEYRSNLFLRRVGGQPQNHSTSEDVNEEPRSMRKLHKFFGVDPKQQQRRNLSIDSRAPIREPPRALFSSSPINFPQFSERNKSSKNLSAFFGERPPDEMIVDQLEQFFPEISAAKDNSLSPEHSKIKTIIEANLKQKRLSKRASALMIRRQTQNLESLVPKGATSMIMKRSNLSISNAANDALKEELNGALKDRVEKEKPLPDSPKKEKQRIVSVPTPITFRWTPGRLIGQGAFGKVFHALNLDSGDFMAVKQVISGKESQLKKSNESLQREIELMRELHHENIVRYIGFEITDDTFNVFLEYVSGGSLSSTLNKCGKFAEPIARSFTAQILCGLEYLHNRDIIHRDIKGANILITAEGVVKISDFGISKRNEYAAYHRMTRMSMQGSVYWMAPEVARGKGYSAKVDIWSCGCLVLEMLTGHVPWHKVQGNVIYLLGTGNSPPIPPELSEMSTSFLKTTFAIDPEKRPTASMLLEHVFTEIDPDQVEFANWSREAIQRKLEEGTTSEEPTTSEDDDDSLDDDTDDENLNEFDINQIDEDYVLETSLNNVDDETINTITQSNADDVYDDSLYD